MFPGTRDIVKASEQRLSREAEQCNEELEKKLHEATLQHLKAKVEQDLELLRKRMPTKEAEAIESALDVKYVRDRQMCLGSTFAHCFVVSYFWVFVHLNSNPLTEL